MTAQQARDYNILLKLKERVESKYKNKNRINIINKKPRIIFMSNIEENKISDEAKQRAKNYMSLKGALEPKQETLEEAAENFVNSTRLRNYKVLFIEGAKWQAKRMYSEEDMIEFGKFFKNYEFVDDTTEGELYAKDLTGKQQCYTTKELLQLWKEQQPKT